MFITKGTRTNDIKVHILRYYKPLFDGKSIIDVIIILLQGWIFAGNECTRQSSFRLLFLKYRFLTLKNVIKDHLLIELSIIINGSIFVFHLNIFHFSFINIK